MSKKLNLNKFINKVLNEMVEIVGFDPKNKSVDVDLYDYGHVDATVKYKDDFTPAKSSNVETHIPVLTNRKLENMLFGDYGSDIGSFLNNPNYAKFDQMNSIKIGIMSYLLRAMGILDKDITSTNVNASSIEDGKLSTDRKQLEHWKEVFSAYYKSLGEICGNKLSTLITWQNRFNDYTLYYKTPDSLLQIMTALGLKKQNAPSGYDAKTSMEYIKGGDKRWVNKWEDSHIFSNYVVNGVLQPNKVVNGVDFKNSLEEALSGIRESSEINGTLINEGVDSPVAEVSDVTDAATTQISPQTTTPTTKKNPQQNIIPNNTTPAASTVSSNKVDYVCGSLEFGINVMKMSPVEFYWFFKNATGILSILEDGNFRKHFEAPYNTVSGLLTLVLDGVTQQGTRLSKTSVLKGTILKRLNGKIEKIDEQLAKSDEIKAAATKNREKSNKENSNGERGGTTKAFRAGIKQFLSEVYAAYDNIDTTSFFEYLRQKGIVDSLREAYKDEKGQTLITNDFFDTSSTPTIAAFFNRFNSKELVQCALTNLHCDDEKKKKSSNPISFAKSVIRSKVGLIGTRISGGHKGIFKSNLETIGLFANRLISQANKTFALVRFLRTLSKGAEQWFNSENSKGSQIIGSLIGEIRNRTKEIDAEAVRIKEIKIRNEQISKGERAGKIVDVSNMLTYGQSIKTLRNDVERLSSDYVGSQMLSSEGYENDIDTLSYEKLHNDIGQLLTATNSLTKNAMKLKRLWEQVFDAIDNEIGLDDVYFVAVRFKDIFDNINGGSNIKASKFINAKNLMHDAEEAFSLAGGDGPLSKMAKKSYLASQKMAHKDESFIQTVDIEDYESYEGDETDDEKKDSALTPIQRYILNALAIQRTKLFFDNVQGYCGKGFDTLREMTIYNTKFPLVITRFFVGVEGFEQFEGIENFEDYSYGDDEWKSLVKKYKKTGQALELLYKTFARILNTKYPSIEMKSTISDESKSNAFIHVEMKAINGNLYQFDLKYPGIPVGESPTMLYKASDYENYIACKFQNKENVNELIEAISEEYKKTVIPTENSQRTVFLPSGKKQAIKVDTFFCNIAEKYEDEVIDSKNQKEHTQKHGHLK